jgi:tRNA(His) 5'-end guanylyltransferase
MAFHTFTRPFLKPIDPFLQYFIQQSFLQYLNGDLRQFWSLCYFQSDEISIVLPAITNQEINMYFGGRMEKLISAFLQVNTIFYRNLIDFYNKAPRQDSFRFKILEDIYLAQKNILAPKTNIDLDEYFREISQWLIGHIPFFDCRIALQTSNIDDIQTYLAWRRIDAIRNYKSRLGQELIHPRKELLGMTSNKVLEKLENEYGINYEAIPVLFKRGAIYRNPIFNKGNTWIDDGFLNEDSLTLKMQNLILFRTGYTDYIKEV